MSRIVRFGLCLALLFVCSSAIGLDKRPFGPVIDEVEVIELNHFYDENCRHTFDQYLFYSWCPAENHYHVRHWRLRKQGEGHLERHADGYSLIWFDEKVLRKVVTVSFRETWTQYDPEVIERQFLKKELRRPLTNPAPTVTKGVTTESHHALTPSQD